MDQTMHSVELTNDELKEILNALAFTIGEGCELTLNIYALIEKLPKPE